MPAFLQRYKAYFHSAGSCPYEPVAFTSDIWPPPDTVRWNFGDPASGVNNLSNLSNPSHIYSASGTYTVELYVRHNDNRTDTTWHTITIDAAPQPVLGPDQSICTGQTATFDAGVCSGCTFEWRNVGSGLVVGSNQTYTTGAPGTYAVMVTGPNGCTGRDTIQLSIAAPAVMSVTVAGPPGTICAGSVATFTATAVNGGTSPAHQWKVNGINATNATNASYAYIAANGDLVSCTVTSSDPCVSNNPASSIPYPVSVSPLLPVSLTVASSQNPVCAGISVTFTATPVNGGVSPAYQWKVNGINAGNATNSSYSYIPANSDLVLCIVTSSEICVSGNPASSNPYPISVFPLPMVTGVATPSTVVCAGNSVILNGTGALSYVWSNGVMNGQPFVPLVSRTYTVTATDAHGCSNTAQVAVSVHNLPVVTANASATQVCAGSPVTLTGGGAIDYTWSNGVMNGMPFVPPVSQTYSVTGTDVNGCSNTAQIAVAVSPLLPVSVNITASANPFCAGSSVTLTASPVNGGSSPGYQWKVNGINAGTNSSNFTYFPASDDLVSSILTSSEICVSGNPGTSNTITMMVNTNLPAGVTIAASANPFCPGTSVIFTATPVNGGSSPGYQWKVNGINTGTNNSAFSFYPVAGDQVSCILTSNLACVTSNPATAPSISMSEQAAPNVTFSTCFDTVTYVTAQPFRLRGGLPPGGTYAGPGVNSSTGFFSPAVAGSGLRVISYSYSNVYSCIAVQTKTILVKPAPSFTCGNTFTDPRDNKAYTTVQIGPQCWMKENLDYGWQITDNTPQTDNCTPEKYRRNSSSVISNYQWDELMQYTTAEGTQGLCPPTWHIPSSAEWSAMLTTLGGRGQAGGPLKDTLLATGFQSHQNGFLYLNNLWKFTSGSDAGAMYWTSTASGVDRAIARGLNVQNPSVSLYPSARGNAVSVRCIRDGN